MILINRIMIRASVKNPIFYLCKRFHCALRDFDTHSLHMSGCGSDFLAYGPDIVGKGLNRAGKLGVGSVEPFLSQRECVRLPKPITHIYPFPTATFFSANGDIYACGANDVGQLGVGFASPVLYRPTPIHLNRHIKSIVTNGRSTAFLDRDGGWHFTGDNATLQLPSVPIQPAVPVPIPSPAPGMPIRSITFTQPSAAPEEAGAWLTLDSGDVYAVGDNRSGQLGIGKLSGPGGGPGKVLLAGTITRIVSDGWASFFILETGAVYAAGWNKVGQLGVPGSAASVPQPRLICWGGATKVVTAAGCTLITTRDGLLVSGANDRAQLASSSSYRLTLAQTGWPFIVSDVLFMDGSTVILTGGGQIMVMGDNRRGQLGIANVRRIRSAACVPFIRDASYIYCDSGVAHVVAGGRLVALRGGAVQEIF